MTNEPQRTSAGRLVVSLFREKTTGGVAKYHLFSQVILVLAKSIYYKYNEYFGRDLQKRGVLRFLRYKMMIWAY